MHLCIVPTVRLDLSAPDFGFSLEGYPWWWLEDDEDDDEGDEEEHGDEGKFDDLRAALSFLGNLISHTKALKDHQ